MTQMNPHARHDAQHIADLLPAYVNGTLNSIESKRVQQHLLLCAACSNELATWQTLRETAQFSLASTPLPTLHTLTQVWTTLEAQPQQPLTQPTQVTQPLQMTQLIQVIQPSQPLQVSQLSQLLQPSHRNRETLKDPCEIRKIPPGSRRAAFEEP